eukprot:364612-Chlamydomonas_euryale.AAC.11
MQSLRRPPQQHYVHEYASHGCRAATLCGTLVPWKCGMSYLTGGGTQKLTTTSSIVNSSWWASYCTRLECCKTMLVARRCVVAVCEAAWRQRLECWVGCMIRVALRVSRCVWRLNNG